MIHEATISKRVRELPKLAGSAVRALSLICRPDPEIEELAECVAHDVGVTADMLRKANSAALGSLIKVGTLRDAIVRCGAESLAQSIVRVHARSLLSGAIPEYGYDEGDAWRLAAGAGMAAERIRRCSRVRVPPYASTAALLHDIGKLVMGGLQSESDMELVEERRYAARESLVQAERQVLGHSSCEAGAALLEAWNLPEEIVAAVRMRSDPDRSKDACTDAVHLSVVLARSLGLCLDREGLGLNASSGAVERLQLNPGDLESILWDLAEGIAELES